MTDSRLTTGQNFSVLFEVTTTRQLLAQGHVLLTGNQDIEATRDAVLACWSIGVERTLKLLYGYNELKSGNPWPNMKQFSHDTTTLDAAVTTIVTQWLTTEHPRDQYLNELWGTHTSNPVWPVLRDVLSDYGSRMRFFHLDNIAGKPQDGAEPHDRWSEIEKTAIDINPRLKQQSLLMGKMTEQEFDDFYAEVHQAIDDTLVRWWFTLSRFATRGAFGEACSSLVGPDLEPDRAFPKITPPQD